MSLLYYANSCFTYFIYIISWSSCWLCDDFTLGYMQNGCCRPLNHALEHQVPKMNGVCHSYIQSNGRSASCLKHDMSCNCTRQVCYRFKYFDVALGDACNIASVIVAHVVWELTLKLFSWFLWICFHLLKYLGFDCWSLYLLPVTDRDGKSRGTVSVSRQYFHCRGLGLEGYCLGLGLECSI